MTLISLSVIAIFWDINISSVNFGGPFRVLRIKRVNDDIAGVVDDVTKYRYEDVLRQYSEGHIRNISLDF